MALSSVMMPFMPFLTLAVKKTSRRGTGLSYLRVTKALRANWTYLEFYESIFS
jgi:hypothetical protein